MDTDVIIWVLRTRQAALDWMEDLSGTGSLACSVLIVAEVLRGVREAELSDARAVLDAFDPVPITYEDAVQAAAMMRDRGPGLVDCHIAAAAIRIGVAAVTYNREDFFRGQVPRLRTFRRHPNMLIGYLRVSTAEQTVTLQEDGLRQADCERIGPESRI